MFANWFSYGAILLPITEPYGLFSIQIQTTCAYAGGVVTRPHGAVGEDDAAVGEDCEAVGKDGAAVGKDCAAVGEDCAAVGNGGEVVPETPGVGCEIAADADGGEAGLVLEAASW